MQVNEHEVLQDDTKSTEEFDKNLLTWSLVVLPVLCALKAGGNYKTSFNEWLNAALFRLKAGGILNAP